MKKVNLKSLAGFLVKAKIQTYAAGGREVKTHRPGFRELKFSEGNWEYRDSYAGFYFAPGQEVVRFKGLPVWAMAYSGGMKKRFHGNRAVTNQTFAFLKKALLRIKEKRPFRGPRIFKEQDFVYIDSSSGGLTDFKGTERILFKGKEVFRQNYVGGLIIRK